MKSDIIYKIGTAEFRKRYIDPAIKSGKVTYDYKIRYGTQAFREKCMEVLEDNISPDIPSKELDFSFNILESYLSFQSCYIGSMLVCNPTDTLVDIDTEQLNDGINVNVLMGAGIGNMLSGDTTCSLENKTDKDIIINVHIEGTLPYFHYDNPIPDEYMSLTYYYASLSLSYSEGNESIKLFNNSVVPKLVKDLNINLDTEFTLRAGQTISNALLKIYCEDNIDTVDKTIGGNLKFSFSRK